jgi:type IV fimbrial biogenesis protein FimT
MRNRGFTLIELLVVVVLLVVLILAVMPGIGSWLRNSEIRNAAQGMVNALQQARAEAVRRNQNVLFSLVSDSASSPGVIDNSCALSSTAASWVVSLASPAGACAQAVSEATAPQILAKHARGDGSPNVVVAVHAADCSGSDSATQVVFNSYGRIAAPSSGNPLRCLDLSHSGSGDQRPLRVLIGTGGTVRLCDPAIAATTDPRHC